jgi:hypothetical protein
MNDTVKTVGTVVGIGVGLFAGWKIYKHFNPSGTERANRDEAAANTDFIKKNKEYLDQLIKKWRKPSYKDAMYSGWAKVLYTAMDQTGSSAGTVLNVFDKMKNDTDVVKLIDVFGIKNKKTINPFSSAATPMPLPDWINISLSSDDKKLLNKLLLSKLIAYRFS